MLSIHKNPSDKPSKGALSIGYRFRIHLATLYFGKPDNTEGGYACIDAMRN